jgi:ABC-2 type transport system permease protein
LGLGAIGLRRAYRATLRFYLGQTESRALRPQRKSGNGPGRNLLVERQLPGLPEDAAAVSLAALRSLSRAPEVKMALAMNVVMMLCMAAAFLLGSSFSLPEPVRPFLATGAVALTFFGMIQVMANLFGFDREGFRALVLLPARRDHILMGRNLAMLPLGMSVFVVLVSLLGVLAHLPLLAVLAAVFQFLAAFFWLSTLGNLVSILAPFRIASASQKATKIRPLTVILAVVCQMLLPLALLPLFAPPALGLACSHFRWAPGPLVNLFGSLALAGLAGTTYARALRPLGALLQRREQRILEVVTREVE